MSKGILIEFSKDLAKEISERPSFDVDEIAVLIRTRINMFLPRLKVIASRPDEERFGLSKIPDAAFLKIANTENGKLQSYIQELEDKIKEYESQGLPQKIVSLQAGNKALQKQNRKLRERLKMPYEDQPTL